MLTANADQIRRLIKILDANHGRVNYPWLENWLLGGNQQMQELGDEPKDSTPEMVLGYLESMMGLRKIFAK